MSNPLLYYANNSDLLDKKKEIDNKSLSDDKVIIQIIKAISILRIFFSS